MRNVSALRYPQHIHSQYYMYKRLNIDKFDITYGPIDLPVNSVFYRGYNKNYASIGDRPSYYSFSENVCESYALESDCEIGAFATTRPLRLYDLRFIRTVLSDLFPQRKSNHREVLESCNTLALAYGVCTYNRQLELFQMRYKDDSSEKHKKHIEHMLLMKAHIESQATMTGINPVETQGFRIAETNNDAEAVMLLREIFGNVIDGYIAPRMYSPYHVEKTNNMMIAELVVFNPKYAGIRSVKDPLSVSNTALLEPVDWLSSFGNMIFPLKGFDNPTLNMKGGVAGSFSNHGELNAVFDKGGVIVNKLDSKAKRIAKKIRGGLDVENVRREGSKPTHPISPWIVDV